VIELLRDEPFSRRFWGLVECKIAAHVATKLSHVGQICVRLFQMDGKALGELE
jgi:hypothetical protein